MKLELVSEDLDRQNDRNARDYFSKKSIASWVPNFATLTQHLMKKV
jgi:hypothetical protein